jgi:kynureninase
MHSPLSTDFSIPTLDKQRVYLCGNSLGLLSNRSRNLVNQELDVWASRLVLKIYYRWLLIILDLAASLATSIIHSARRGQHTQTP